MNKDLLEIVKSLIVKGADINAKAKKASTPLLYAVENKNGAMIELLLEHGAEINVKNFIGNTPLHNAAIDGDIEICILCLFKIVSNIFFNIRSFLPILISSELSSIYSNNQDFLNYVIFLFIGVYVLYKSFKGMII